MLSTLIGEKYGAAHFDHEFQRRIAALAFKKTAFLMSFRDALSDEYFEQEEHVAFMKSILFFYDKHGKAPEWTTLKHLMQEQCKDVPKLQQQIAEAAVLKDLAVPDENYIIEQAVAFGAHQAFKKAVLEVSTELATDKPDYEALQKKIDEARRVGQDRLDLGRRYIAERATRKGSTSLEKLGKPVPTCWVRIDQAMQGGAYPSQLCICVAPPKRGKSLCMVNIAAAALLQGFSVFYYTMELSAGVIEERVDQRMIGKNRYEVQQNWPDLEKVLLGIEKRKAELVTKFYPMMTATVRNIRDHMKRTTNEIGKKPDLVIVDYGALLKPSKSYRDSSYQTIGGIYQDLKGMAGEHHVPIWSPIQANRSALSKDVVTEADLAETFIPAQVCDFMFAQCANDQEVIDHRQRFYIVLNRNGLQGYPVHMLVNKAAQVIREDDTKATGAKEPDQPATAPQPAVPKPPPPPIPPAPPVANAAA